MIKHQLKWKLMGTIIGLWLVFGVTYHIILMYILTNQLVHCIFLALFFGGLNYFIVVDFYSRNVKLNQKNTFLENQVYKDALTGLLSRQSYEMEIESLSWDCDEQYSVVFVDVDDFKLINDKFGHDVGDRVLQMISTCILSNIRLDDQAYRYGGEEILILLKNCSKDKAYQLSEKIRFTISKIDMELNSSVTISMGVSSFPDEGSSIQQVIKQADKALMIAKKSGKNQVHMF